MLTKQKTNPKCMAEIFFKDWHSNINVRECECEKVRFYSEIATK
jgi:hypothetical protein